MGKVSRKDFISDLPLGIIDFILTKLPIRDAVRTSILSSKWRYQWTTMTQLVFDEKCLFLSDDKKVTEKELVNFIMRLLLLHHGPVEKFNLSTTYMKKSNDVDQLLLFLSRKDLKELVIRVYGHEWRWHNDQRFRSPRIFSFQKLTRLTLFAFSVKLPFEFQGFPYLKYLHLDGCMVAPEVIENLISGCPLLESFKLKNDVDPLALTVRAPSLKHLTLDCIFKDFYLKHTPLLVALNINFFSPAWDGKILKKIPVAYDFLKFIEVKGINFVEMNEVSYVLRLLLQSPNLEELQISVLREATGSAYHKAADLEFWEEECPIDFTFKHLKVVKMSDVSQENDIKFLKFVLERSPVLELMSVSPNYFLSGQMKMVNEVLSFQRASPKVEIKFFE